jgi:hypothetical protein
MQAFPGLSCLNHLFSSKIRVKIFIW